MDPLPIEVPAQDVLPRLSKEIDSTSEKGKHLSVPSRKEDESATSNSTRAGSPTSEDPERLHRAKTEDGPVNSPEPSEPLDPVMAKRVVRKIDKFLLPAMILGHGLVFYDKAIISSAVLFKMPEDLGLFVVDYSTRPVTVSTSRLSWAISMFFFGMLAGIYPMTFLIQRLRLGFTLGVLVCFWGLTCALTAAVTTWQGLYAQRFFLGFIESVIPTAFMTIVASFYTQQEQSLRQALWFSSTGLFTIIGGGMNYGFAQISGGSLHGWQYIYILAGCLTVIFGIWCFFVPSNPMKAKFLTPFEQDIAIERLRAGQTGIRNKEFKMYQVIEAFTDIKLYLIFIMMASAYIVNGAVSGFGPLIVQSFGYDQLDTILFQFPLGFIAFVFILLTGWISTSPKAGGLLRKIHITNPRTPMLILCSFPIIAGCVMIWKSDWYYHAVTPVAGFCLLGFYGPVVCLIMILAMANVAGSTKRSVVAATVYTAYCVGNIVGPQLVVSETKDQHYPELYEAVIISYCIMIVCSLLYYSLLKAENKRRDALNLPESERGLHAFDDLTDKENLYFRYVL